MLKGFKTISFWPKRNITQILKKRDCILKTFEAEEQNQLIVPVFKKALLYLDKPAIRDYVNHYTYLQLYTSAKKLSRQISNLCGSGACITVGFYGCHSALFSIVQWATWISGQIFLPINWVIDEKHKDLIRKSETKLIIATTECLRAAKRIGDQCEIPLVILDHCFIDKHSDSEANNRLILQSKHNEEKFMIEGVLDNDFYTKSDAFLLPMMDEKLNIMLHNVKHEKLYNEVNQLQEHCHFTASDKAIFFINEPSSTDICISIICLVCLLNNGAEIYYPKCVKTQNKWDILSKINSSENDKFNTCFADLSTYKELVDFYEKQMDSYKKSSYNKCLTDLLLICTTKVSDDIKTKFLKLFSKEIVELKNTLV